MRKTMNERFERQEKENEKIWQAIKEGFEFNISLTISLIALSRPPGVFIIINIKS